MHLSIKSNVLSFSHNASVIHELVDLTQARHGGEGETITATQAINSARLSPGDYFSLCVSALFCSALPLMNSGKNRSYQDVCGTGET